MILPLGEGETVAFSDLYCRDYGGKSRVHVELTGEGWTSLYRSFTIPRDDDNDGIADCWEHTAKAEWETVFATNIVEAATNFIGRTLPTEPRDPDGDGPLAAHASAGDGLSPFEEYRGVALPSHALRANPLHQRLSPARKEILVEMHIARGGGTNATVTGLATGAMETAARVFGETLGIDMLWYVGGLDFDMDVDAGSPSNTVDAIPEIFTDPRFSNDPGTTNAVLAELFGWEAGAVQVFAP